MTRLTGAHLEVQLDADAIVAERNALLAELTAERFGALQTDRVRRPYADEVHSAWRLRRVAERARRDADAARARCSQDAASTEVSSR